MYKYLQFNDHSFKPVKSLLQLCKRRLFQEIVLNEFNRVHRAQIKIRIWLYSLGGHPVEGWTTGRVCIASLVCAPRVFRVEQAATGAG